MMMKHWFKNAFCAGALVVTSLTAVAQQPDFNEVGKQMVIMLQNSHYARLPFNADLSRRFLKDYLSDLDYQHLYFTQKDVDHYMHLYGDCTHTMLLDGECMKEATDIYALFKKRVEERVKQADDLLNGPKFDFTKDEHVMMSRKDAKWPADKDEASRLWKLQIKEAVLSEILRRDMLARLAKEQDKPVPASSETRSPRAAVKLRYKRFLKSVEDVDQADIADYFLNAVAMSYDPHTDYMSYRQMSRFRDTMKNELVGIGALLQAEDDGSTKIMGIVVGGPADRQGSLKLNDKIVGVDSLDTGKPKDMVDTMFMKIDKVVDLIRGKEGTSVALKIEPAGGTPGQTKIIVIPRGKVKMKDEQASAQIIDVKTAKKGEQRLGVIRLPSFYADFEQGKVRCSVDVERLLKRLVKAKIDGLLLDLRDNGGGSLEEVRRMTGFFTGSGPVVQVKNTLGQVQVKDADDQKPIYTGPMVVMVNKNSASASEILAGALQDYNRAVIVGDTSTFGKGTVQQPMNIGRMMPLFSERSEAGWLKVTIQKFYRPSGSSTQLDGVTSNIPIPSITDALQIGEAYLPHALPHDRISRAPDFEPLNQQALFIPRLKELSEKRVNASKDFAYTIQDIIKTKKRISKNELSLNEADRMKDLIASDAQQKTRNAERRKRFAKISQHDKKTMTFYRITLDDLNSGSKLTPYDPSKSSADDYMRRAKDDTADLDDTPDWPSGLDPVKRESLSILGDLVDLTDNARVAGLIKK